MKYIMPAIIALFVFAHPAFSQENDSLAKKSFSQAQNAYAEGQYKEALDYLKSTDIYSGGATPRSLYLKIKALNQLTITDKSYVPALQTSCNRFFEMTDKNTYPQEKYQEITNISKAVGGSGITTTTPVTTSGGQSKSEMEKADYDKAIKTHTKEGYKEFLDKYSFTPLANDIKRKYDELVDDDYDRRNHRVRR
jgi:hypothetical protein